MPIASHRTLLACLGLLTLGAVQPAAALVIVTDSLGSSSDKNLPFGSVPANVPRTATVTVTNSTLSAVAIGITDGLKTPFNVADPGACPGTLQPSAACTLTITYLPVASGTLSDSLTLSLGGTPAVVTVSGTAVACSVCVTDSLAPVNDRSLPFANTVAVGGTGTATVTITNNNQSSQSNLVVRLTAGLAAPFSLPTPTTCDGVTLSSNTGCTLAVRFAPTSTGLVSDSFILEVGSAGTVGASTVEISVSGTPGVDNADFQLSKTAVPATVQPGASGSDLTTFTVTLRNNGPDAAAAVVTDLLPAGLNFVSSAPGQGTYTALTGLWDAGTLATGAQTTLQVLAQAAPAATGCIVNTATVAAAGGAIDLTPGNNSVALAVGGPGCADLQIGQQTTSATDLGQAPSTFPGCLEIRSVIQVRNIGPSAATGAQLTVNSFAPASNSPPSRCSGAPVTQLVPAAGQTFALADIPAGQTVNVTIADFVVADEVSTKVSYQVSLAGAEPDPESSNNTGTGSNEFGEDNCDGVGINSCTDCFIATAAYGSFLDPEVQVLRQFRDRFLLTTGGGRDFVAWYYRVSPLLADDIRGRPALRALTRAALTPLVYAVKFPVAALLMVLGVPLAVTLWRRRRSKRKTNLTLPAEAGLSGLRFFRPRATSSD